MKINKLNILTITIFILTISCATNKRPKNTLEYDNKSTEIYIDFTDKTPEQNIQTNEDYIEKFIEENNVKKHQNKDARELVEEQQQASTIEPCGKYNFENTLTRYRFSDGKLYSVITSSYSITDIRLEAGEVPTGEIMLADSDNYTITNSTSYENGREVYHIFIRCFDEKEPSVMILPTNKRTYYFKLIPSNGAGMLGVKFIYSEKQKSKQGARHIGSIDRLNFNYVISGEPSIKPIAAFSDDKSSYIQFKPSFQTQSASPALYLQSSSGFSVINYSVKGNMYIADFILDSGEYFVLLQDGKRVEIKKGI